MWLADAGFRSLKQHYSEINQKGIIEFTCKVISLSLEILFLYSNMSGEEKDDYMAET